MKQQQVPKNNSAILQEKRSIKWEYKKGRKGLVRTVGNEEMFIERYQVGEMVANGGQAMVRKALDKVTGMQVALKIYDKTDISGEDLCSVYSELEI